jgi:hypothetical protein
LRVQPTKLSGLIFINSADVASELNKSPLALSVPLLRFTSRSAETDIDVEPQRQRKKRCVPKGANGIKNSARRNNREAATIRFGKTGNSVQRRSQKTSKLRTRGIFIAFLLAWEYLSCRPA